MERGRLIGQLRRVVERYSDKLTPEMRAGILMAVEEIRGGRAASGHSRVEKILKEFKASLQLEELTDLLGEALGGAGSFQELMAARRTIIRDPSHLDPLSDPPGMCVQGRDRILRNSRGSSENPI